MSDEKNAGEEVKDTPPVEPAEKVDENKTTQPEETPTPKQEPEAKEEVDYKALYEKEKEVSGNYKKENEKYRKPRKVDTPTKEESGLGESETELLQKNDYLSKREDIIDEHKNSINALADEQWSEVEPLIGPAMDALYVKAQKEGRYVARGELSRTVEKLLNYAKGGADTAKKVEEARIEGIKAQKQLESAEIGGTKTIKKSKNPDVTESDYKVAESKGWKPERAMENRKIKEQREKDYAVQ